MTQKQFNREKKEKEERKRRKEKEKIKRKLIKIAIGTLNTSHIQVLPDVVYVYILYKLFHIRNILS